MYVCERVGRIEYYICIDYYSNRNKLLEQQQGWSSWL